MAGIARKILAKRGLFLTRIRGHDGNALATAKKSAERFAKKIDKRLFTVRASRRCRGRMPCGVIDAALIKVDDCNGTPAREKRDSQKQCYGDCSGTDMACDFCFHRYALLPFPSENFARRGKILWSR